MQVWLHPADALPMLMMCYRFASVYEWRDKICCAWGSLAMLTGVGSSALHPSQEAVHVCSIRSASRAIDAASASEIVRA